MKSIIRITACMAWIGLLGGCDSQSSQSLLPEKQGQAAGGAAVGDQTADPRLGMWKWETDQITYTDSQNLSWVRKHNGTLLVEPGESAGRYKIRLNFRQHSNIGTLIEKMASSEQDCVGVASGTGLSIQCTIDPVKYPNWMAADFSFSANEGQVMRGVMLSDSNAPVVATKM